MLVPAIVTINLALVFYSVGVWGERIQGILKPWHAVAFGLGLTADATGTFLMTHIAASQRDAGVDASGLGSLMAVSGTIATTFHRFSLVVWTIWLIPYVAGTASAMGG